MKKVLTFLIICLSITSLHAQYVAIPDTNLATKLQQIYPTCFNGNLMDTTCTPVVQATSLLLNNASISNLSGIEYFDNLKILRVSNNQITSISSLPPLLDTLICRHNLITNIQNLPPSLKYLDCYDNLLTTLNLANGILYLNIGANQFPSLPNLPNSMEELNCIGNLLTNLSTLPNNLIYLDCSWNSINTLPAIPASLLGLSANGNNLNSLPSLPPTLEWLYLDYNHFTSFPPLPSSLEDFWCASNNLTNLPLLPVNMVFLDCSFNQITALPPIPSGLTDIWAYNNSLTYIPELPDSMFRLLINDNPTLLCLPGLKKMNILNFNNTGVQCLPNYGDISSSSPPLNNYPICDIINPNGCDVYWNISGKVYGDLNSNCIDDSTEFGLKNLKLLLYDNSNLVQQTYSVSEGTYAFKTPLGTYDYTVDTSGYPFILTCPSSLYHNSVLTLNDSIDSNMNFALECKPGFDVGVKYIVRESGTLFPGDSAIVKIGAGDIANFYGPHCANGLSGTITVSYSGPVTYISPAPGALTPVVTNDSLIYSIADFGTVDFHNDFRFVLVTDTTAQPGFVCFVVFVQPYINDNDLSNNLFAQCLSITNSYDPNSKEVFPSDVVDPAQEWLTYTISFQNTGNAPAKNIYIVDTLSQYLLPETFTLLSYSHEPIVQLNDNNLRFNFPNINLPDSTNDEPNSHGFVQYKIKLVPNLPIGTIISNTAFNYFDFNSPVATNTVYNLIDITNIDEIITKNGILLYPNPSTGKFTILLDSFNSNKNYVVSIFNSIGGLIREEKLLSGGAAIDITGEPVGIYHVRVFDGEDYLGTKLVVSE